MVPGVAAGAAGGASQGAHAHAQAHPAVRPVLDALATAQQAFTSLATGQAWIAGTEASARTVEAWLEASRGSLEKAQGEVMKALGGAPSGPGDGGDGARDATAVARRCLDVLAPGLDPRAPHPVAEGLDRTFTALAGAFGLAPSRALLDACRDLSVAEADRRAGRLLRLHVPHLGPGAGRGRGAAARDGRAGRASTR